jgi:hypothetical protein
MDYRKVKRTIREIKQASKQAIRSSRYLLLALSSRRLWILDRLESITTWVYRILYAAVANPWQNSKSNKI